MKNKKKYFRENCFENVVSVLKKIGLICLKNYFEKKGNFKFLRFMSFYFFHFFLKVILWTNIAILLQI